MVTVNIVYAIIAAVVIALASYSNLRIVDFSKRFRSKIISFSAGIAVTYVFLQLFPEFVEKTIEFYHPAIFLTVLLGFTLFFLTEKYVYQHYHDMALANGLELEDSLISFIYHFIIGLILVGLFLNDVEEGILFSIPIFLNTAVHVLPLNIAPSRAVRGIVASSTLLGVLFAAFLFMPTQLMSVMLIGFLVGTLLFSIIRHSLPSGKEGKPTFFIAGMLLYCLLIFSKWSLQGYNFF